jgi:primosomal protein N'
MERVNGYERINIYVQSLERKNIQNMLNIWLQQIRQHPCANKIKWNIDVDPI